MLWTWSINYFLWKGISAPYDMQCFTPWLGGYDKRQKWKTDQVKDTLGFARQFEPITLNNPCSILKKKPRHCHFTFTRFSTMDQKKFFFVHWLDDCLIALKSSKNAPISKLFSFLIYDFSLRSYVLCVLMIYIDPHGSNNSRHGSLHLWCSCFEIRYHL